MPVLNVLSTVEKIILHMLLVSTAVTEQVGALLALEVCSYTSLQANVGTML
jgi:hypothetical protein